MRRHDWSDRLEAFIESRRNDVFEWGRNDCALFVADAVKAMTGTDPAKGRRRYSSEKGARKLLRKHGGLHGLACKAWGDPDGPLTARRGDVALVDAVDSSFRPAEVLAVCLGAGRAITVSDEGLTVHKLNKAKAIWHA